MSSGSSNHQKYSSAMRFAGLGFQWAAMLGIGVWGGMKLDERIGLKALFVIIFPLLALGFSLYQLIKELNRRK